MQHTVLPALTDSLFSVQTAPEAAVPHPAWEKARTAALDALEAGGVTLLTGPPGSGKSLLLKHLARTLRDAGTPVHLVEHAAALDGAPHGAVVLVDEADALDQDTLAALCASPAPALLAALPGFSARLSGLARPVGRVVLGVLSPHDVARYVAARLDAAGRPRNLLDPEAVLALARHSGGLLRLVNTLGGAAVFLAGLDGSPRVGAHHVEEAASMRDDLAVDLPAEPAPDATPAALAAAPAAAPPAEVAPDYRREVLRRRTALGAMVAASGLLFATPWLTRARSGATAQPQGAAGGTQALPTLQPQDAQAPAVQAQAATAPTTVADAGAPAQDTPTKDVSAASAPEALGASPAPSGTGPVLRADAATPAQGGRHASARPAPSAAPPSGAGPVRHADAAPALDGPRTPLPSAGPVLFQGPIYNETMGQGGRVTLMIRQHAPDGAITARFEASQGLSGSGCSPAACPGQGASPRRDRCRWAGTCSTATSTVPSPGGG